MGNKMSLTEATMLALQGRLVENKLNVPSKQAKVEESINVNVDETTNINVDETAISIDETTTVVETPEATIIIEEPQPEFVEPVEEPMVLDTPVEEPESIEVPVEGDETIIPEEIVEEPIEEIEEIEIVEEPVEETPEELEENKEECSKCVRLTLDGKIYWEGTEEEFKADEEGLKLMACDIYEEDTGATRDADEVNVEYVDCLEECKETEETVEESLASDAADAIEHDDRYNGATNPGAVFFAHVVAEVAETMGDDYSEWLDEESIREIVNSILDSDDGWWDDMTNDIKERISERIDWIRRDDPASRYYEESKSNPDVLEESKLEDAVANLAQSKTESKELKEVKDITPKTEKTFLEDLKFIKELGGFDDNFKTSQKAKEILNKLSDDELAQLAFDFSNKPEHHDLTSLYHAYIFGLESKVSDLDSTSEDVKEDVKEEAVEEPILEEKKSLKFNAKSFNESLTKYFKANYKTVENIQINKVGINNNGIKVEAKLTSVDAKDRTICLEMNKVSSAKSFAKYTLKEATGLLKENKQNVDKLTMMTFTNKDNVLECKYLICK